MKRRSLYTVTTGSSTSAPASEANSATATSDGGNQETNQKAKNTRQPHQKQKRNTQNSNDETTPSEPLRLPKPISRILDSFRNEATEIYIIPDSILALAAEAASLRTDPGCWILFRLPPIETQSPPKRGLIFPIKGPLTRQTNTAPKN